MADQHITNCRAVIVEFEPSRNADDLIAKAFQLLKPMDKDKEPPTLSKIDKPSLSTCEV